VPQFGVHGLGQHGLHPVVRLVAAVLFTAWLQHRQLRLAFLVESFVVNETIRAGADFGGDFGSDVGVGRLDLLDFLLGGPVLGFQQQVQRLDHRRLADLVGSGHHDHTVVREVDLAVVDAAVVLQDQPM
jgi:hypothetical protein